MLSVPMTVVIYIIFSYPRQCISLRCISTSVLKGELKCSEVASLVLLNSRMVANFSIYAVMAVANFTCSVTKVTESRFELPM